MDRTALRSNFKKKFTQFSGRVHISLITIFARNQVTMTIFLIKDIKTDMTKFICKKCQFHRLDITRDTNAGKNCLNAVYCE